MTGKIKISDETRKRIEEGLRDWDNPNSEARRRFENEKRRLKSTNPLRTQYYEVFSRLQVRSLRLESIQLPEFLSRYAFSTRDLPLLTYMSQRSTRIGAFS